MVILQEKDLAKNYDFLKKLYEIFFNAFLKIGIHVHLPWTCQRCCQKKDILLARTCKK